MAATQIGADLDYNGGRDTNLKKLKDKFDELWMQRVDHLARVSPFDPDFMDHLRRAPAHPKVTYKPWEDSMHVALNLKACCDRHQICYLDAVDALKAFHAIPCQRFDPHGLASSLNKKSSKSRS